MAQHTKRLNARTVATLSKEGLHADGDGLYLVIDKSGAKRWSFIFQWHNKRKEMGLGKLASVGLAESRLKAAEARKMLADGINPIEQRKAALAAQKAQEYTFGVFAEELIARLQSGFRNEKHIAQWKMTVKVYASPLNNMPLNNIETPDVLKVLKPIWHTKAETASRLRGRIERILDAAKAQGLRSGENPARWRGHLDALLPKRQKLTRGHHAAMAYSDVPAFMESLRDISSFSARALEWTILSASRSNETLCARWDEIDLEKKVWTIPATRMKAGRAHRVPLTERMLAILHDLQEVRLSNPYLFAGMKEGKPLSSMSLTMHLRRMKVENATVHGFRSAFRDWVSEETPFPREIAEAALAHVVGDATERAYRRGDALEKRRELLKAWENYCSNKAQEKVIKLHG